MFNVSSFMFQSWIVAVYSLLGKTSMLFGLDKRKELTILQAFGN